jgi:hypothetical protein
MEDGAIKRSPLLPRGPEGRLRGSRARGRCPGLKLGADVLWFRSVERCR